MEIECCLASIVTLERIRKWGRKKEGIVERQKVSYREEEGRE